MMEESTLRARRRRGTTEEEEEDEDEDGGAGSSNPVAKLVRMALACEYGRKPIRRGDITEKGMLLATSCFI